MHKELSEIKAVMDSRKEKESGKYKILKGHRVITRPEVIEALEGAESVMKKRRARKRQHHSPSDESELSVVERDQNDERDAMDELERPVYDCVIVQNR